MFYTIRESLNKSICTTSGNMIHHFIYGLWWDHKKLFIKCRSIKFGLLCVLNVLHLLYFVYGISACSTF